MVDICSVSAQFQAKQYEKLKGLGQTEAQAKQAVLNGHWGYIKGSFDNLPDGTHIFDGTVLGKFPKQYRFEKHGNKVRGFRQDFDDHFDIIPDNFEKYLNGGGWDFDLPGVKTPVSSVSKSVGNMSDEDVATLFVKTKDDIAKAKGLNIKGVNPELDGMVYEAIAKQIGYTPSEVKAKIDAYKATGKKLSALKKKTIANPSKKIPKPNGVPVQATTEVVHEAAEDVVQHLPAYMDEDVAKAYIKAKDQISADPDNPWTLYTQNNEQFEQAIFKLMEQGYGIHLPPSAIKNQIANYLGSGNKLSVLKKKMAKSGEYTPKADTLKKKKGDPTGTGKTSKTQAQKDIADAAEAKYIPENSEPFKFDSFGEQDVFNDLSNKMYAAMNPESAYDAIEAHILKLYKHSKIKPSVLDIVRVYDAKKAHQLGIANGNFYEKKVAEYASSPAGQAKIIAKKNAEELEKNLPPLPADSAEYGNISPSDAQELQNRLDPWTPDQRRGLTTYTGGSYRSMNQWLRGDRQGYIDSGLKTAVSDAQKGMRAMPQKMLVHRGCDFEQFGLRSYEQALQLVGKTVQDKGFLSTSAGGSGAFSGSVALEIEISPGTMASYIQSISNYYSEKEMLIAAGTKYEVLSVRKSGYQTTVRIRTIPGTHTKGL